MTRAAGAWLPKAQPDQNHTNHVSVSFAVGEATSRHDGSQRSCAYIRIAFCPRPDRLANPTFRSTRGRACCVS